LECGNRLPLWISTRSVVDLSSVAELWDGLARQTGIDSKDCGDL